MYFLPTWLHGIFDYAAGMVLLFAPEIFSFNNVGGTSVTVIRALGLALIAHSLLTDYAPGVIRRIPMPVHLTIDFLVGLFLALSPWILGFSTLVSNAWMPHLFSGIVLMVVVLISGTINVEHRHMVHA